MESEPGVASSRSVLSGVCTPVPVSPSPRAWGHGSVGCFFFFQAEDGIRDADVTGVQTCALPILNARIWSRRQDAERRDQILAFIEQTLTEGIENSKINRAREQEPEAAEFRRALDEIGRASCRERV